MFGLSGLCSILFKSDPRSDVSIKHSWLYECQALYVISPAVLETPWTVLVHTNCQQLKHQGWNQHIH
ncbi:hypothetical protein DPMN_075303 [Dreissena polymorpha]|uniref:Uncharacterized protein n=1 Tax=Dreissena polymorpha TaxID=45954 RepID=A0A9D3YGJ3_DREPO|nr:hypothetical protein DPMN_075303 [Dreissena polymorpha]